MADQSDFMRNYQTLAQQSWDAWTRQLQQQPPAANPFFTPPATAASGSDVLERTLAGMKSYFDLMQGAAAGAQINPAADWRQQLQQMFGGASQPFAQAFGGIDTHGAEGFARQWQSWLQAAQQSGFSNVPAGHPATPAFGLNREQQMQQQEFSAALMESMQASATYQALIQRANAQAVELMQGRLAQHAEPGRQIDSPKALYDLWVDCAEEAYAQIALSEEFRTAYGEMVNTQMRVRKMQQAKTEELCKELGMPTRSEVSSIGERLQQLRRELRSIAGNDQAQEILELRRELNALKRQLAAGESKPATTTSGKPKVSAVKKAAPKKSGQARKAVPTIAQTIGKRSSKKSVSATSRKRK
jgi:polyhydroxyalkanoate synthase subunit PhaE